MDFQRLQQKKIKSPMIDQMDKWIFPIKSWKTKAWYSVSNWSIDLKGIFILLDWWNTLNLMTRLMKTLNQYDVTIFYIWHYSSHNM